MKIFSKHFAVLALSLLAFDYAEAYDFEIEGVNYNIISMEDKTVEVAAGQQMSPISVTIPEFVVYRANIYKVVSIGDNAFKVTYGLHHITIPNSVKSIGKYAFLRPLLRI